MPTRVWTPNVGGARHTVVVRWNPSTFAGELVVEGAVIQTWGGRMAGPDIKFELAGHHASIRKTPTGFDLFVDREKVRYQ
jgi:hypothetical protein